MEELQPSSEIQWEMITTMPRSKWTEKRYSLDDVAEKVKLPEVVRVCGDPRDSDLSKKIDSKVPLLVYSRRRRTKVYGELLWWDAKQKSWVIDGPPVEIPKDYTGWFEILKTKGGKLCDFPAACTSISQIAKDQCSKFLVRSTLISHKYTEDGAKISLTDETDILPGEILEVKGISKRKWKVKDTGSSNSSKKEPESCFLKCTDHREDAICVSFAHPGQFSPIFDEDREDKNPANAVYQILDILDQRMDFPTHVKLAFGCMPPLPAIPRHWTGVMRLVGSVRPDSLVMCSLIPDKVPLVELPVDSDIQVQLAMNKEKWQNDSKFRKVIDKCFTKVYPFVTSIKYLDMKYKKRELKESNGADMEGGSKTLSHTTSPVEMTVFNPMEVFPQLPKKEDVSDSWTLSFKDPEHISIDGQIVAQANRMSLDATVCSSTTDTSNPGTLVRTHNRRRGMVRLTSVGVGADDSVKQTHEEVTAKLRALRERQMSTREANC